jgi:hypothetical protein
MSAKYLKGLAFFVLLPLLLMACGASEEASGSRVFFTSLEDGATVSSPVKFEWSAEDFTIEPAGEIHEGAGHLHLLFDTDCIEAGIVIPTDDNHVHFGKGQTEAELELAPGEHTVCLQAADGVHAALEGEGMTQVIKITVE